MKSVIKVFIVSLFLSSINPLFLHASNWIGEALPTTFPKEGVYFYIYSPDAPQNKWMGALDNTGKYNYLPRLVDEATAKEFKLDGSASSLSIQYYNGYTLYYLKPSGENALLEIGELSLDVSQRDNKYALQCRQRTGWITTTYYLDMSDNEVYFHRTSTAQYKWLFISKYQRMYRPQIDEALVEVADELKKDLAGSGVSASLINALTTAKSSAEVAIAANPADGEQLREAYKTLIEAYSAVLKAQDIVKVDAEWESAFNALQGVMDEMGEFHDALRTWYGRVPATYDNVFQKAVADLSIASKHMYDKEQMEASTMVSDLQNLKDAKALYSSRFMIYVKEMEMVVNKMDYYFSENTTTEMHKLVKDYLEAPEAQKAEKAQACINFIITEQNNYKTWVNNRITNEKLKFAIGTDFTAYILNNSFELGTVFTGERWQFVKGCSKANVVENKNAFDGQHGEYIFNKPYMLDVAQGECAIKQDISYLPVGRYRLSAAFVGAGNLTIVSDHIANVDDQHAAVTDGGVAYIEFDMTTSSETCTSTIGAYGKNGLCVDNFTLQLIGGINNITAFECSDASGFQYAVAGEYERVTVNRNFTYNSDPDKNIWNSLCSPCDIDEATTAELFSTVAQIVGIERDAKNNLVLKYVPCNSIEAGMPYLVKTKKAFTSYTVQNAYLINKPVDPIYYSEQGDRVMVNGNFQPFASKKIPYYDAAGTFGSAYKDANTKTYVLAQNQFLQVTSNSTSSMKAFRVYFHIQSTSVAKASGIRLVSFDEWEDESETSIDELEAAEAVPDSNTYNLLGQPVKASATGMTVQNGKIRVIRK